MEIKRSPQPKTLGLLVLCAMLFAGLVTVEVIYTFSLRRAAGPEGGRFWWWCLCEMGDGWLSEIRDVMRYVMEV